MSISRPANAGMATSPTASPNTRITGTIRSKGSCWVGSESATMPRSPRVATLLQSATSAMTMAMAPVPCTAMKVELVKRAPVAVPTM